jgi:hypothetical protein
MLLLELLVLQLLTESSIIVVGFLSVGTCDVMRSMQLRSRAVSKVTYRMNFNDEVTKSIHHFPVFASVGVPFA